MLTDEQYQSALDNQLPLLSPKGISVWIKKERCIVYSNEEEEVISAITITLFTDEDDIERVMDTHTFKESFEEVPECRIPKPKPYDPKNINAAKAMKIIK